MQGAGADRSAPVKPLSREADLLEEYFGSSSARRAAGYFDHIFKGEKQPIYLQAPTKYELASKLKTAKALGLEIPSSVLSRADEVIE